ncbi:MAG: acyl carrier protein [Betaproteobacteria bacterium]|nr:acyl carrier protein [Betaproteobacteria bacterium]
MNRDDIRARMLGVLKGIAPELEEDEVDWDRPWRGQVDLDSMDFLNFVVGLHQALQVDIPEADYGRLKTLNGVVEYLAGRLGA